MKNADRFGWPEMVAEVLRVYETLNDVEKSKCAIRGSNYGDAGAVSFFGSYYGLPKAYSAHNNYWIWGPPDKPVEILITCGPFSREELATYFETVEEAGYVSHPYAIFYENNYPIYICRGFFQPLAKIWPDIKSFN